MQTIYKYPLEITDEQVIATFDGCLPILFAMQNGEPHVWCRVDPSQKPIKQKLIIAGTGHPIVSYWKYVGTIMKDGFVWHLFYY